MLPFLVSPLSKSLAMNPMLSWHGMVAVFRNPFGNRWDLYS